jgi:hypothetical protein
MAIAKRSSHRKATVAVARELAVITHAMSGDGTFSGGDPTAAPGGCPRAQPLLRRASCFAVTHEMMTDRTSAKRRTAAIAGGARRGNF